MKKITDFANYLARFFSEHLAGVRNLSKNTITAYRDTYRLLLLFCRDVCNILPEKLSRVVITFLITSKILSKVHC